MKVLESASETLSLKQLKKAYNVSGTFCGVILHFSCKQCFMEFPSRGAGLNVEKADFAA